MTTIESTYAGCHPRTIWYLNEISYCLVKYYGFTQAEALDSVLNSRRLRWVMGSEEEAFLWHDTPLRLAYEEAQDRNPHIEPVGEDARREYREGRFSNPPPEAVLPPDT